MHDLDRQVVEEFVAGRRLDGHRAHTDGRVLWLGSMLVASRSVHTEQTEKNRSYGVIEVHGRAIECVDSLDAVSLASGIAATLNAASKERAEKVR